MKSSERILQDTYCGSILTVIVRAAEEFHGTRKEKHVSLMRRLTKAALDPKGNGSSFSRNSVSFKAEDIRREENVPRIYKELQRTVVCTFNVI